MQLRLHIPLVPMLAFAAGLSACAQDKIAQVGVTASASGTAQQDSALSNATDSSANSDSGTDGVTSLGTDTSGAGSLDDVLKSCGVDQATLANPSAPLFKQTMYGYPQTYTGSTSVPLLGTINFAVVVVAIVTIDATTQSTKQGTDFNVAATPSEALGQAKTQVAPQRGYVQAKSLSLTDRTALMASNPDWNGIICTVQPVSSLTVSKGGFTKVVSFSPPLPMSISPKADLSRYEAEIGSGKTFSNIKATVTSSDDPNTPTGTVLTGSVTVAPTDKRLTLATPAGTTAKTISADVAYMLKFAFGVGNGDVVSLGLMPQQQMYIDATAHNFKAIAADTGVPQTGIVVLSPEFTAASPTPP